MVMATMVVRGWDNVMNMLVMGVVVALVVIMIVVY